jgi:8-oxo-dGTP pyrophosphatase MutT (NUDIX family)
MGAGVLPVTLYKGALFLLLGQERNNNLWGDFGGKAHKGERPFETAIREGIEELNGFLGDENEFEALVTSNMIISISYDKYTSYIFKTNYDKKLPYYFSNVNKFAEQHLKDKIDINDNGLFEKKQIQWYPLSKLKEDKPHIAFREFYKPLINSIVKNERFIINFLQTMD